MQQIGVEALVEGLASFTSDIRSINSSLESVRGQGTLLQRAFGAIGDVLAGFGRELLNIAEFALGHILGDAIEFVVSKIQELIKVAIDAGSEFQTLELRLQRLNFNGLIESGMDYNEAQKKSIDLTKEQLEWLQKLAAQTPYDAQDIANTFTLARSYGLASDAAKGLTEDIIDFASGMGLGNQEIERIIINFGQMIQQGKVTQREMNDLARGSLVPVNDILKKMQQNLGMSTDELTDFRKTAASVPEFMKAFSQLVEERFSGAAETMAKTFKGASANVLDLIKSIGGMNVVKPILDVIGAKLAAFVSSFTDVPERWDRLVAAAKRVGNALADVVNGLFGLLPSSESLADTLVSGIEKIAIWIEAHKADIVAFFKNIGDTIRNDVIPWIRDKLVPVFERISEWIAENKDTIFKFFSTIGQIVSDFFSDLTGGPKKPAGGGDFLDSITQFMQFVIDNKDEIVKWVEILWSVFVVWQVLATIGNILLGVLLSIGGIILSVAAAFATLSAVASIVSVVVGAIGGIVAAVIAPLLLLIVTVGLVYLAFKNNWGGIATTAEQLWFVLDYYLKKMWASIVYHWGLIWASVSNALTNIWNSVKNTFTGIWTSVSTTAYQLWFVVNYYLNQMWASVKNYFSQMWASISQTMATIWAGVKSKFNEIVTSITSINWAGAGKGIIDGVVHGIQNGVGSLISAAKNAALAAYKAALAALGIHSPSTLFMEIGVNTMEGMALGIEKAAGLAVGAMAGAMSQVVVPALSSMAAGGGNNYENTNNYNLTVNSASPVEPIVQDYNMLASLQG